jgi:hypothetical protein
MRSAIHILDDGSGGQCNLAFSPRRQVALTIQSGKVCLHPPGFAIRVFRCLRGKQIEHFFAAVEAFGHLVS